MQKGFSTLEVVIAVFVISVLLSCAVPNAARIVDRVSLDYEIKRLYTEMRFVQSFDRMSYMRDSHFNTHTANNPITFEIKETNYIIKTRVPEKIYEQYFLPRDFKISYPKNMDFKWITFDHMGEATKPDGENLNGHIVFTSRRGKKLYFVFDTVGRFRGSRTRPPS